MNKQELTIAINQCITERSGIEIYFGLKNGELRKANFLADTQQEIKGLFVQEIRSKIIEPNTSVIDFSSADQRKDVIIQYDLDETEGMQIFNTVLDAEAEIPMFSFDNDDISNICYFLVIIGNENHQIVIYKQLASINIYKKNSGLFVRRADNEFTKVEEDFLRITPGIDFFKINGNIFIINLKLFEQLFNLYNVVLRAATAQIEIINRSGLVENTDSLLEDIEKNVSFAKQLSKITETSPVLNKVPNPSVIAFAQTHPALKNVIKYSDDKTKIKLTTKKSKLLFVKLLNDDYLTSELTKLYYDSLAKDTIPDNNNEE